MTDGGGADRMTGASSGWWRDMAPDGPQRWGRRQWVLLALALSPVPLMLVLLAIVAR